MLCFDVASNVGDIMSRELVTVLRDTPLAQAWAENERMPGENWPLWPSYAIVPIGFGLLAVRFLIQCAEALTRDSAADEAADIAADDTRAEGFE